MARERMCAQHGVTVAEWLGLLEKFETLHMRARRCGERVAVARGNDHADFLDAGLQDFLDEDRERGLGLPVAGHECLQRERALVFSGGGDDGFADFQRRSWREWPRPAFIAAEPPVLG